MSFLPFFFAPVRAQSVKELQFSKLTLSFLRLYEIDHWIEIDARKSSPCAALELRTWEEALTSGTNVHWLIKH